MVDKPLGCVEERGVERGLAGGVDCICLSEVDLVGGHQADACVMMVFVIRGEEAAADRAGLVDRPEPFWELGLVFQDLEVGLRERGCRSMCAACGAT